MDVEFLVIKLPSPYNLIMGRTCKSVVSGNPYKHVISFLERRLRSRRPTPSKCRIETSSTMSDNSTAKSHNSPR
ncbi:hypothetical protein CsSME_00015837 [Camellia sinensis var. sinensis]